MIVDGNLLFDPASTAVTTTAASTNVLDLFANRDLGVGRIQGKIIILVQTTFASGTAAATLNVQLQAQPNGGTGSPVSGNWQTLVETGTVPIGALQSGQDLQFDLAPIANAIGVPVTQTGATASSTTVTLTAANAGIINGMTVVGSGIPVGTYVASGYNTTSLTLSQAATTTVASQLLTFIPNRIAPRFLRLNYVCSNTMTAGTVQAFVALDVGEPYAYPPGVVVPN